MMDHLEEIVRAFFPDNKFWIKNKVRRECRMGGIMYLRSVVQYLDNKEYPSLESRAENLQKRIERDRSLASSIRWYTLDLVDKLQRSVLGHKKQLWVSKDYQEYKQTLG